MNDRELLLLAAKAAGLKKIEWWESVGNPPFPDASGVVHYIDNDPHPKFFNPLLDDAEAFRLSVELDLDILFYRKHIDVSPMVRGIDAVSREDFTSDKVAATRRAIVRAAAEIGKSL